MSVKYATAPPTTNNSNKTIAAKNTGQSQIYEDCKQRLLKTITNNQAMKDYVDTL